MKKNVIPERETSFLKSAVGKKIFFLTLLLIFVLGMMLYSYYSQRSTSAKWSDLLQKMNDTELVRTEAYRRVLNDLRTIETQEYNRIRKKDRSRRPEPSELREGIPEKRGRILPFEGRVVRQIPIELPVSGNPVTIHDLRLRSRENNLVYRIHLLSPPASPLKTGSTVSGDGVYLTTLSQDVPEKNGNQRSATPEIYIMARTVTVSNSGDSSQQTTKDRSDTTSEPSSSERKNPKRKAQPPRPDDYSNRKSVTTYWNRVLALFGKTKKIDSSDPLIKKMIREVSRVPAERLHSWANPDVHPDMLKPLDASDDHRGTVVEFRGKYLQHFKIDLIEGFPSRKAIWQYWIRDQKNHLTYTFYSFRKADFALERGTPVQGKGVFLNTQVYDLLNPGSRRDRQRHAVVMGYELNPSFTAPRSGEDSSLRWIQYLVGGLIVLSLGAFLLVVYVSLSDDSNGQPGNVSDIRKRKREASGSNGGSSDGKDPSSNPSD